MGHPCVVPVLSLRLFQGCGGGGAVEDAVEEEFEGGVGLASEGDFGAVEDYFAFAHGGCGDGGGVIDVALAPGPAAGEEVVVVVPGDGVKTGHRGLRVEREG